MTSWLRTAGLLLVLGTGAVVNPCGGVPAYGVGVGGAGDAPASGAAHTPSSPSASATARKPASGPDHHAQDPAQDPAKAPSHASAEASRAGSRAGEGRERPGRTAQPSAEEDESGADDGDTAEPAADESGDGGRSAVPTPADSASPSQDTGVTGVVPSSPPLQPVHQTVAHAEDPTEPVLRILPLGSGLILIGLGLGLAFIGLRVRRG
ncbi:hypothetical protein AB0I51_34505 [Streptomyces sp. NPDC050549]|uniref:hypothetical protein n=1 Tax=Streptomyces sp. NPDC050549 TaxID=3155406 RepID=UPI0034286366